MKRDDKAVIIVLAIMHAIGVSICIEGAWLYNLLFWGIPAFIYLAYLINKGIMHRNERKSSKNSREHLPGKQQTKSNDEAK